VMIHSFMERMTARASELAVATPDALYTYGDLLARTRAWHTRLAKLGSGCVVSIEGDPGLDSVAAFLGLTWARHIAVPLSPDSRLHRPACLDAAGVEHRIILRGSGRMADIESTGRRLAHSLYGALRADGRPGVVLFAFSSSGQPRAAVHDLTTLVATSHDARRSHRTRVFLRLDRIEGVSTLFDALWTGAAVVLPRQQSPAIVRGATGLAVAPAKRGSPLPAAQTSALSFGQRPLTVEG
jgi:hypothetical protein